MHRPINLFPLLQVRIFKFSCTVIYHNYINIMYSILLFIYSYWLFVFMSDTFTIRALIDWNLMKRIYEQYSGTTYWRLEYNEPNFYHITSKNKLEVIKIRKQSAEPFAQHSNFSNGAENFSESNPRRKIRMQLWKEN